MTRDELLAWLWLPWNLIKTIALTLWWIVVAVVRGEPDD